MSDYVNYYVVQSRDRWAVLAAFDRKEWMFKYKKLLRQVDEYAKTNKVFKYQHEKEL